MQLPFKEFVQGIFTGNGNPSSSRVISAILSLGCLGILAALFRHLTNLSPEKLSIWLPNLPYIVASLAFFAQSPYGINRIGDIFSKKKPDEESAP